MLATIISFASTVLERQVRPLEARFEHPSPPDRNEHQRVFGQALRFRCAATELVLPAAMKGLPLPKADPRLLKLIKTQAADALAERLRGEPLLERVETQVRAAILGSGAVSLVAIAASLGVGPRTLQRGLRERGQSFRAVADAARITLAKRMLRQPELSLAEIAHRLGYSQASAFHRAFIRIAGMTPRMYQRGEAI
jgi:AraC-like DNA-binding protein